MQRTVRINHLKTSDSPIVSVLRNRSFIILWIAQICSQTAINTLIFILALRLYEISHSNTVVSGLFLVYSAPAIIFGLAAGTIVDKFENKYILITSDIIRACMVGFLVFMPHSVPLVYILTFINSFITQFYMPALAPTIPFIVPAKNIVSANGLFTFTYFSTLAIGTVLAGPLLNFFGSNNVFLIISILFLSAAACAKFLPRIGKRFSLSPGTTPYTFMYLVKRLFLNLKEVIVSVNGNTYVKNALLLLILTQIVIAMLGVLGPGYADSVIRVNVRDASIFIMGPAVLGLIVGSLWISANSTRFRVRTLILTGLFFAGILLCFLSIIPRINAVAPGGFINHKVILFTVVSMFFLLGFANSILDIPANTILQEKSDGSMRGRVYGILSTAVGSLGILPVILGGLIADTIGVDSVLMILGICVIMYAANMKKSRVLDAL